MNWRSGFFRFWLVSSALWGAFFCWEASIEPDHSAEFYKIGFIAPLVFGGAIMALRWIFSGFRVRHPT